jgi:hypothetical protein
VPDAAILTAVYGQYDAVKAACPQQGLDAEWVLVTDDPTIPDGHLGWRVVLQPRSGIPPVRAAKHPKLRPWEYTSAPASVWVDGSVTVTSPSFAADALALADPIAQFAHPDRDCIYDEAAVSATIPRYASEPVLAQAEHYRHRGHPEHWGLWAATVIARRHTPPVLRLGTWWTFEVGSWSFQDQISQPFVLRQLSLRPAVLPGHYRANQWLAVSGSGKHW